MSYATNPLDGVRTYFEDTGGRGAPIVVYPGFADPLAYAKTSPLVRALEAEFRLIFADHRGQGRSDKPHDVASYSLATRVGDVVALLDALNIERAHFLGFSWGARLGFAVGASAPERVLSLALCGNQPYEWPTESRMLRAVSEAASIGRREGITAFVESWEAAMGETFSEPGRSWMLDNDPVALDAAFRSALSEGRISTDLSRWGLPCLIYVGREDEMYERARRASNEIPGARFLALPGHTHFSAERAVDEILPHVLQVFRSTS